MTNEEWDELSSITDFAQMSGQNATNRFARMLQLKDEQSVATASLHSNEDLIKKMRKEVSCMCL